MPALKKVIKQKQEAEARTAQMKAPKKIDSGLSNLYKYEDYNINKSQDSYMVRPI